MDNENLKDNLEVHEDCGCGQDNCECGCEGHEPIMVNLEDENGEIVQCEVVDGFVFKENEYTLVQHPKNGSVYLFKVVGNGDEGELVVPDDEEFAEVSKYYSSVQN